MDTECLYEGLDQHIQENTIYTDFSKAFDKNSKKILLSRLAEVDVGDTFLK